MSIHTKKWGKVYITPYLMLIPCFVIFIAFVFFPFVRTIYLSFHLTNSSGEAVKFYGIQNFVAIFQSDSFWNSLFVSLKFAVLIFVPTFVVSFILACMANERMRGSRLYETMYSLPMAVASAPAAAIWFLIFSSGSGILNYILHTDLQWLDSTKYTLFAVAGVTVWMNLGANFIFLVTGLRNVPDELIESAKLDGAGYLRRLFHIVIPVASGQLFFVIFLDIVVSFQAFAQIKLLTLGGPAYTTDILVYNIYRSAFLEGRFDYACVLSLILFVIIFFVTRIQFALEKRTVHYN